MKPGHNMTAEPQAVAPSLVDVARSKYTACAALVTQRTIAKQMDASPEWVRRFVAGEIPNPGVRTLEAFIKALDELSNV